MTGDDGERRRRFDAVAGPAIEPLRRYLVRRADAATADDVLSEVLLVCWRRLDAVPDEPLPWLYGVARLQLRNAQRSARRRERLAARAADELQDRGGADGAAVHDALAALRPQDAELLRLWAWEGLAPADLGPALGISANAAAIRLHRAKRALAAALLQDPEATSAPAGTRRSAR